MASAGRRVDGSTCEGSWRLTCRYTMYATFNGDEYGLDICSGDDLAMMQNVAEWIERTGDFDRGCLMVYDNKDRRVVYTPTPRG
jgi:hypothetical protein